MSVEYGSTNYLIKKEVISEQNYVEEKYQAKLE